MVRSVVVWLCMTFALSRADRKCDLTITVDAEKIQGICQSGPPPSALINTEIQNVKEENSKLKKELEELREEYKSMVESVKTITEETQSWREIIEWPITDPTFKPDNDTLYIDPDGPTYKDCVSAVTAKGLQGIYVLEPEGAQRPFAAYCDEEGWTVIQRRFDGKEDFYQGWDKYMGGFGRLGGEFWLGLENIYQLTLNDLYEIRTEALAYNGKLYYSVNPGFKLTGEEDNFRIFVDEQTEGNYRDVISTLNNTAFTTFDNDNDDWSGNNCAYQYHGAFWLKNCGFDLNREFCEGQGCMKFGDKIVKKSLMKIRPSGARSPPSTQGNEGKKPKGKKPKKLRRLQTSG